ncbi:NTF2-like protein [Mycena floridula]|nr:NTF2-like protein [Mycena floridula]
MPPASYDPNSEDEKPVALPSAPLVSLSTNAVIQPPLTRRGTGPGMIAFLPSSATLKASIRAEKPLDPEPVQKWAEEGFAVVGVTAGDPGWTVAEGLSKGIEALLKLKELDTKDKFAVVVYDSQVLLEVISLVKSESRLACLVAYGTIEESFSIPAIFHLSQGQSPPPSSSTTTIYNYPSDSPYFVLPQTDDYHPGNASLAHSRALIMLRKYIGGPVFDIEAIWEEHTYFEFEVRSVAKTMGTMVAEPYVNHVPTMTGGIGRKNLSKFYRDHFIFANPADTEMQLISRTVGADRIVDEFIFKFTHDRTIDWLLPGVPPTGKKLAIPMLGVINVRGDRLYHEHIWWDQATVLLQAGLIPSHVPFPLEGGQQTLRLPAAGVETARLLADETDGKSNEMFGSDWGIQS